MPSLGLSINSHLNVAPWGYPTRISVKVEIANTGQEHALLCPLRHTFTTTHASKLPGCGR